MKNESPHEAGKKAAAWLATCFVVGGGASFGIALSVAFFDNPIRPLLGIGAALVVFGALVWLLRDRPDGGRSSLLTLLFRRDDNQRHKVAYRLSRRKPEAPHPQTDGNGPPSVERIRELSENTHTWVPNDRRLQGA